MSHTDNRPTDALWGLPDPDLQRDFYADVPLKRFLAWIVDFLAIAAITAVIVPFTAFTAILFLPALYVVVSVVYRILAISRWSATPGMRLMAIEFRSGAGQRFDFLLAAAHTGLYTVWMSMLLPQIVSMILMLTGARGQGLSDLVLGTAALNRAARH